MREIITLQCSECKRRNYTGNRNKKIQKDKVELKTFPVLLDKEEMREVED